MKRCLLLCLLFFAASCSRSTYHVKPSGNDGWSGSALRPLASLEGALSRIRQARESGRCRGGVEIILEEGTYRLSRPVVFGPADSSINVKGRGMGKTVLSSGVLLPPFEESADGIWEIDLGGVMNTDAELQQLYVNGTRAVLARTPDEGALFLTGKVEQTVVDAVPPSGTTRRGMAGFRVHLGPDEMNALAEVGENPSQLKVTFLHAWNHTRRYVCSLNMADSSAFAVGNLQKPWNTLDNCSQLFFEDDISLLDSPGEWYYEPRPRILKYIPRKGEKLSESFAEIPASRQLICVEGTADEWVKNLIFSDMSLDKTLYHMDWRGSDQDQAASKTDAAIMVNFASGIVFRNCEICNTGNNGIWFRKACRHSSIEGCILHDLGIGGVKIGETKIPEDEESLLTKHISVDGNVICRGGRLVPTGVGIFLANASDCSLCHNEISDFYYTGISVGWRWGYEYSPSKRNAVRFNHIHHLGMRVLSDMGGIYTLGPSEGTEVTGNYIHDIDSFGYGGWGLYTDEGSTGILMRDNLVCNCKSSGFHQHYGKDNIITNNIFINQKLAQLEATRVEDHLSFTFTHNIVCCDGAPMYGLRWDKANADVRDNIYWNSSSDVSFNGLSLDEWQKESGKDYGSVVLNPGFADVDSGDFTVMNVDAVRKTGFVPFDWTMAGPRASDCLASQGE